MVFFHQLLFCFLISANSVQFVLNFEIRCIFGILQQYRFGYAVSDDTVYQYITSPPVSKYFSELVLSLREQCFHLDVLVHASKYALSILMQFFVFFCRELCNYCTNGKLYFYFDAGKHALIKKECNYLYKLIKSSMICITLRTYLMLASLVWVY